MQKELLTNSPEETEAFGAEVGRYVSEDESAPKFIALYGDLGVGKTAFVRGLASVIAPDSIVRSPTFALVNEYRAKNSSLFHFDMYRINDEDELYSIGFYDYLDRGVCVTEWSENIPYALPESYIKIEISKTSAERPDERKITAVKI
jgi:tRNA threonylcarbamoyladenosine biosynthesis protein TsaE